MVEIVRRLLAAWPCERTVLEAIEATFTAPDVAFSEPFSVTVAAAAAVTLSVAALLSPSALVLLASMDRRDQSTARISMASAVIPAEAPILMSSALSPSVPPTVMFELTTISSPASTISEKPGSVGSELIVVTLALSPR